MQQDATARLEKLLYSKCSDSTVIQTETGSLRAARKLLIQKEAVIGIEPMNKGFADLCLTTWLHRRSKGESGKAKGESKFGISHFALRLSTFVREEDEI